MVIARSLVVDPVSGPRLVKVLNLVRGSPGSPPSSVRSGVSRTRKDQPHSRVALWSGT